jgi:hypothetical protein
VDEVAEPELSLGDEQGPAEQILYQALRAEPQGGSSHRKWRDQAGERNTEAVKDQRPR